MAVRVRAGDDGKGEGGMVAFVATGTFTAGIQWES